MVSTPQDVSVADRSKGGNIRRIWALIGLVITFGWTFLLAGRNPSLADTHNDIVTIVAEWIVVLVLAVIGFGLLRRGAGFYGFRGAAGRDILAMLGLLVLTYIVSGAAVAFLRLQTSGLGLRNLAAVPLSVKLILVITAGICEEFMFRGFAIEELADWTGSLGLGGLIAWLAFVAAHIDRYGLTSGLVIPAIGGGGLTLLYVWRRNLPACMFMHAVIDGVSIFLLPLAMKGGPH